MDSEKNRNTELAALSLIDKVLPAMEEKKYAICIFLDYRACFDTISRDILYEKLERYGIRGLALKFIKSYFCNRKQYVLFNSCKSDVMVQNLGVVQGSKCGPLFFDIYSNEFSTLCSDDSHVLYADDTSLIYVSDDLTSLTHHVNDRLAEIVKWCNFNKISLNPVKSEYMIISNKIDLSHQSIRLQGADLTQASTFKYLGLHLDSNLKFNSQIAHVNCKLSSLAGITHRLGGRLSFDSAKNLYYSCVFSTVNYCLAVWGGAILCTHQCDRTFKIHKRIVRNLFFKHFKTSSCLFRSVRLLKLDDIYKFSVSVYMFKMLKLSMYPSLKNSLNLTEPEHLYPTRNRLNYNLPFPRVDSIRINYKFQFTNVWNELPVHIKDQSTLGSFKRSLKEYLLEGY